MPVRKTPLSPASSALTDIAYQRLREAIRDGTVEANARLREEELARWLKMSRTPIRSALRRLAEDGLLVQEKNRGAVVAMLDYQALAELYAMREALECTAAGLAARHASTAEIAVLFDILEEEPSLYEDEAGLTELNMRFHNAIYRTAHNRFLMQSLPIIRDPFKLLDHSTARTWGRITAASLLGRREAAHEEHLAVVRAIERRDPAAAEEATRLHVRGAQRERLRLMHEHAGTAIPAPSA